MSEEYDETVDYPRLAKDLTRALRDLQKAAPDAMQPFNALAKAASAQGSLDMKTKELIATAIGVAVKCDGCIAFHVKAAIRHGATRQEMVETLAMNVYLGGGPAAIYAAKALEAYDQFTAAAG